PDRILARTCVSVTPGHPPIPARTVFVHQYGTGGHLYETMGPAMRGAVAAACWAGTSAAAHATASVRETRIARNLQPPDGRKASSVDPVIGTARAAASPPNR